MIKVTGFGWKDYPNRNELEVHLIIDKNHYHKLRKLSERRNVWPHEFIIDLLKRRIASKTEIDALHAIIETFM